MLLSRRTALGFWAAAAMVLAVAALDYHSLQQQRRTSERVRHTLRVLQGLHALLSSLKDAETGQRGFLLTGKPGYLRPYEEAVALVPGQLAQLRELTQQRGTSDALYLQLSPLVEHKLEELARTVALYRQGQHGQALAVVETDEGQRTMEALRRTVRAMEEEQLLPLEEAGAQDAESARGSFLLTGLGSAALLALILLAAALTRRELQARSELEAQVRGLAEFQHRLIAVVSHDTRTPLTVLRTSARLLRRDGALNEAQVLAVERIDRSTHRIDTIVRILLDFTRARLGRGLPVTPAPTRLAEVVARVLEDFRSVHPEQTVWEHLEGKGEGTWDADRLAQLLTNLLANAVKYGDRRYPIHVTVRDTPEGSRLEVHNRGNPIDPELLPTLFAPFRRGPGGGEEAKDSLGLGLYIVSEIAAAHGGRVSATSSEREGTTFRVDLPPTPPSPPGRGSG